MKEILVFIWQFVYTGADFDPHQRNAFEWMNEWSNNLATHLFWGSQCCSLLLVHGVIIPKADFPMGLLLSSVVLDASCSCWFVSSLPCYLWLCAGCYTEKLYVEIIWQFLYRRFLFAYARHTGVLAVQQIFTEYYWGSRNTVMNKKWFLPLQVLVWISNRINLNRAFKE